jgi:uncharacterized Fe-S cluster protein YjdI
MIKKEYTKGELTVMWQPDLCIHSGVCFHNLPEVFKPRERPWVQLDGADEASVIETVNACPSGALSIKPKPMPTLAPEAPAPELTQVKVFENGPVRVLGPCEVTLADGTVVVKPNGISFCRCGGSSNKPFCDGSHKINGFIG